MTELLPRTMLGIARAAVAAVCLTAAPAGAADESALKDANLVTPEDRKSFDLSGYTVTDPSAGYFDVEARRRWLKQQDSALIKQEIEKLRLGSSCRNLKDLPVLNDRFALPGFYPQPDSWRLAAEPFFKFEDAVSKLAGRYVVTGDPYYAECVADFLGRWADGDGFLHFEYKPTTPQAWFAVESSLFAAGFSYSILRDEIRATRPEAADKIEAWLKAASRRHAGFHTIALSCCNNHFYRRGLHASVIGIATDDDDLLRFGVSAIYSALREMNADGSLPREMLRGSRRLHYQNYATLYLVFIAEMLERQGYDIYEMEVDGRSLHTLVNYSLDALEDPDAFAEQVGERQDLWFMDDPQYFAWMEVYGARFPSDRVDRIVRSRRPIYNRSAGGFVTLYFYRPSETEQETEIATLADRSFRLRDDYCAKHPQWRDARDTAWRVECEERLHALQEGEDADLGVPDPKLIDKGG
ncbi:alginate lyase family protein [Thalassobaculum sp. OXR-137]|uniref:alginate lyase family protein n=1 Tax=Thalassobaculum sp. OXR-137 TaxID=3100173 RepID=UPI002AC9567D|nr:alginate lyase family protein [Thalassobaculum sp. OXR-137]WPZ32340.1 alginate lyase family protein [Thalassobaculum sp. OXR-137]